MTDMPLAETLVQDAAALARGLELSSASEAPPSSVPGYHILRRLGAGKFGSVWLAREQNTGKFVAIKFYAHRRGVDWSLLGREVEKLAVLYTSRNIVRLLAVGWDHDPPYYVMEYLPNGSLAERLSEGPLPPAEAVRMATRVAQALVHAHGSGILHCDLKPANVLLDQDGEPRLCDFGQSRLADERSHSLGTLFYMAPEQADLQAVPDARWDVYALGALLYHMLCGEPPHRTAEIDRELQEAGSLEERLERYRQLVLRGPRPSAHRHTPGVDAQLADIVDHCLAMKPERRFANAQAVLDKLLARERFRAQRPLILTGLALPAVLMLALLPFALDALHAAISTSRSNLVQRALESDVLSANLLSDGMERELRHRLHELERIANDNDVRTSIVDYATGPMDARGPMFEELKRHLLPIIARVAEADRVPDASWFLQDAAGVQRWRYPASDTVEQSYAWRDYFHGQGDDFDREHPPADLAPIRRPHISRPFRSDTGKELKVSLSVPVFNQSTAVGEAPRKVIGVFARTMLLSDLLKDYERSLQAQGSAEGRKLALVDRRTWSLLAHHWMTRDHLKQIEDPARQLRVDRRLTAALDPLSAAGSDRTQTALAVDRVEDYRDPVAEFAPQDYGGEWLAAFSPVGDTGWVAVVQEPRGPVLRPVEAMRERLIWTGVGGMTLVSVLVTGGWWLLLAPLGETRPRWWPRRWSAAATQTTKASESA